MTCGYVSLPLNLNREFLETSLALLVSKLPKPKWEKLENFLKIDDLGIGHDLSNN